MLTKVAKQHAQRVAEKLGVTDGLVYLRGEKMRLKEDSDMPRPFYQRRYFYYLSGYVLGVYYFIRRIT